MEAGYNSLHDVRECAGYVLTFTNGKPIYVTGDTSTTEQMPLLAEKEIDYAFFCCDGVFNMGLEEAAQCAEMVKAKHNIPDDETHQCPVRAKTRITTGFLNIEKFAAYANQC